MLTLIALTLPLLTAFGHGPGATNTATEPQTEGSKGSGCWQRMMHADNLHVCVCCIEHTKEWNKCISGLGKYDSKSACLESHEKAFWQKGKIECEPCAVQNCDLNAWTFETRWQCIKAEKYDCETRICWQKNAYGDGSCIPCIGGQCVKTTERHRTQPECASAEESFTWQVARAGNCHPCSKWRCNSGRVEYVSRFECERPRMENPVRLTENECNFQPCWQNTVGVGTKCVACSRGKCWKGVGRFRSQQGCEDAHEKVTWQKGGENGKCAPCTRRCPLMQDIGSYNFQEKCETTKETPYVSG